MAERDLFVERGDSVAAVTVTDLRGDGLGDSVVRVLEQHFDIKGGNDD